MDEQRLQAYVELISKLFACPRGQEESTLQQHSDLMDEGLVQKMMAIVAQLRQQEQKQHADWLENLAELVAQMVANVHTPVPGDLNATLQELFQPVQDMRQVGQRIQLCKQALVRLERQVNETLWASLQSELGRLLLQNPLGDRAQNLEDAISAYELASQVYTRDNFPKDWADIQHNLATTYVFRVFGSRAQNIEDAIPIFERALEVRTRQYFPDDWAETQSNLATTYFNRVEGDRKENIEKAISILESTFDIYKYNTFPENWAKSQRDLGTLYSVRIKGDRASNIEAGICALEKSLMIINKDNYPIDWAMVQASLSVAYFDRLKGDRTDNIEKAISLSEKALEIYRMDFFVEEWCGVENNLAACYSNRTIGDPADNIEIAISAFERVLEVRRLDDFPQGWADTQNNLAIAYRRRVEGDLAENIEKSIEFYRQSLTVRTKDSFPMDWATTQHNLASAYTDRIEGDRVENIEKAIQAYQQALTIRTKESLPEEWAMTQSDLATTYVERIRGDRLGNIKQAISAYTRALEIFTPDIYPNDCRRTSRLLANLYADRDRWSEAQTTYRTALAAAEILYQAALSKGSQEAELKETNDLYRRAAYAYAKVGDLETAIATIEQGRARSLSETLQRDRADLEAIRQINPELVDRYQTAANAIRLLESTERRTSLDSNQPQYSAEDFRDQATQARQTLQNCLTEIRQIPGYESFLALPTFADIAATLQPSQILTYLIPTPNGSLALVVSLPSPVWGRTEDSSPAPQTAAIWLDDFTEDDLLALLTNDNSTGWFDTYQNQDRAAWRTTLDHTLHNLWQPVLVPILRHLSQAKKLTATLIPTGLFGLLPLHAAWTRDASGKRRYACDFIQFTYAPNALALPVAREVATQTPAMKLLAVNDPQPVSASSLPSASIETANAIATFPGSNNRQLLQHEAATPVAVLAALPSYPVAHFSCHGSANFQQPLDSGLLMANDATLTLRDLLDLKLKGLRLAVLSACETGIPGTDLPDEVISLPTGLLQAGAAGVVSSLWSVDDHSTMVLLSRFYQLWRPQDPALQPLEPPEALCQAQQWLRDSTGPELAPYLQASHPELAARFQQATNQRPFAHPFYWAAFTYTGV
jgi:CHAT domain-containing protein